MFYILLIVGVLLVLIAVLWFIYMYYEKEFTFLNVVKTVGAFLIGVLFLAVTLPSLKYMLLKEYDVVSGECTIGIISSGRSTESTFEILDTGDMFYFRPLDAYGQSIPYYCELTVTKDHKFEVGYKIYDVNSRELIVTSE